MLPMQELLAKITSLEDANTKLKAELASSKHGTLEQVQQSGRRVQRKERESRRNRKEGEIQVRSRGARMRAQDG